MCICMYVYIYIYTYIYIYIYIWNLALGKTPENPLSSGAQQEPEAQGCVRSYG